MEIEEWSKDQSWKSGYLIIMFLIVRWNVMGKDLRNKELGLGISQRKDGVYVARFTNRAGKRIFFATQT